ncbi:MAG: DUF1080 domain-containing protein [Verrucomicrobiota bacterium]
MKHLLHVLSLGSLIFLAGCCSTGSHPSAAIQLFNGKDLVGWKAVSADPNTTLEQVWSVKDGLILCTGTPMGYLHTEQKFTNYRLVVEYRWAPGKEATNSNSGVFGRINGEPRKLPRCIETQLKHGSAGDLYGFHGMTITRDKDRSIFKPGHEIGGDLRGVKRAVGNEKTPGEWNHVEILAQGGNYTVWFNSKLVNQATGVEIIPGFVGLQSEGGEVHFRKVAITPLD